MLGAPGSNWTTAELVLHTSWSHGAQIQHREREREKKKPSFNGRSGLKLASECGLDRSQAGERGNFPALSQKVP